MTSWIITQKDGLILADKTYAPLEHRAVYENGRFYGVDNLVRLFETDQEWAMFLSKLLVMPTGTVDTLSWRPETPEERNAVEERSKPFIKQVQEETKKWLEFNDRQYK